MDLAYAGLILSVILFGLGLIGVLARRNAVFMLMSMEIMLNASALAFIAASARWGKPDGQVMFVFILAVAASEVSVGLALLLNLHRIFADLNIDQAGSMHG